MVHNPMQQAFDFCGKVALVTGAASGIGRAAAKCYAACGAQVVVADVNEAMGQETVKQIKANGGQAAFVRCDVSDEDQVKAMVDFTITKFGRLDMAFNNAGVLHASKMLPDLTRDDFHHVMSINVLGVFFCMKHEIIALKRQNGEGKGRGGAIVNTASICGEAAIGKCAIYVASKHAVMGLTKSAAMDHANDNIRVNALMPGVIDTPLLTSVPLELEMSENSMRRQGRPEELAPTVMLLSSDLASSYTTGSGFLVDGGQLNKT